MTLAHPIVARDYAGPDIAIRPFVPATRFQTYLPFPPHRPRERLASAFVDVLRGLHDELLAEVLPPARNAAPRGRLKQRARA
ncbi:hypothetical protein OKW44_002123 [Paraburkholderia sp. WSM4174]